jgi:hypothetical protein
MFGSHLHTGPLFAPGPDLGTFGASPPTGYGSEFKPTLSSSLPGPSTSHSKGDRLHSSDAKTLDADRKILMQLQAILSTESTWIQTWTNKLLHNCRAYPGSDLADSKLFCQLFTEAWQRSFALALSVDVPGYSHFIVVHFFAALCRPAMNEVFASDDLSQRTSILTASYAKPLRDMFSKIQFVFQSPNSSPGAFTTIVKRFHRMNSAELKSMLRNWLAHPRDGLEHAEAERISLDTLQQHLCQLFYTEGGLDMARDALVEYEAYHFGDSWKTAMDNMYTPLSTWLNGWWSQKLHLLSVAIHRESMDYILSTQRVGRQLTGIRPTVLRIVQDWARAGVRPASDFTVEWVQQYEIEYVKEQRLIDVLYGQLPTQDPRWIQGQVVAVSQPLAFNSSGVPSISHRDFNDLLALRGYTALVIQVLEQSRLSTNVAQLQIGHMQTAHALEIESIRRSMKQEMAKMVKEATRTQAPHNSFQQGDLATSNTAGSGFPPSFPYSAPVAWPTSSPVLPVTFLSHRGDIGREEGYEVDIVDIDDDWRYTPVPIMSYASMSYAIMTYTSQLGDRYALLYKSAGIDKAALVALHPITLQRQIWRLFPPKTPPNTFFSISALTHSIRLVKDAPTFDDMFSELCAVVNRVYLMLGGTRSVTRQDLGGCQRTLQQGISHLCPGSHSTLSCPQARCGGLESPVFSKVYDMVTHDKLMEQCRLSSNDGHDSASCKAHQRQYNSCRNCKAYLYHHVYPVSLNIMLELVKGTQVSESDKHEYRVQLATGFLTAAWSTLDVGTVN